MRREEARRRGRAEEQHAVEAPHVANHEVRISFGIAAVLVRARASLVLLDVYESARDLSLDVFAH